jgi:hypothetical protein
MTDYGACHFHEDYDLRPAAHLLRQDERRAGLDGSDGFPPVVEIIFVCEPCYRRYGP